MYLDSPAFPINFPVEQAVAEIESMVKGRYWHDFEVGELKLVYTPFWTFSYDAFTEAPGAPASGEGEDEESIGAGGRAAGRIVSETSSGKMALNARTYELVEEVSYLYESAEGEMQNMPTSEYPYEIQRPKLVRTRVAERIIAVRLAAQLGLPKENVILSGLELVYLPQWFVWVTVAEGTFHLQINAYNGEMVNSEQVPERERGWLELTSETLEELKQPDAWIEYTREISQSAWLWFAENRQMQVILLGIIAVLVALWTMGYI